MKMKNIYAALIVLTVLIGFVNADNPPCNANVQADCGKTTEITCTLPTCDWYEEEEPPYSSCDPASGQGCSGILTEGECETHYQCAYDSDNIGIYPEGIICTNCVWDGSCGSGISEICDLPTTTTTTLEETTTTTANPTTTTTLAGTTTTTTVAATTTTSAVTTTTAAPSPTTTTTPEELSGSLCESSIQNTLKVLTAGIGIYVIGIFAAAILLVMATGNASSIPIKEIAILVVMGIVIIWGFSNSSIC